MRSRVEGSANQRKLIRSPAREGSEKEVLEVKVCWFCVFLKSPYFHPGQTPVRDGRNL
jgi:hypothetical protein